MISVTRPFPTNDAHCFRTNDRVEIESRICADSEDMSFFVTEWIKYNKTHDRLDYILFLRNLEEIVVSEHEYLGKTASEVWESEFIDVMEK